MTTCASCGRTQDTLAPGAVVDDRYELREALGQGGMGVVFHAWDRLLEEEVALKVLRPDIGMSPDLARRFRVEIRLARRVRHPNVCAIHEYGEQGSLRYIAMEFVRGVDLRRILLDRGPFDARQAAETACQVAAGLQAIHDVGIVHRDLKAANVMRDRNGTIRVMDFGIAKELGTRSHVTTTGLIVGTPEYMSPEQGRGEPVDGRTDIYSLGILTFELLAGRVPFHGSTPVATILKHLTDAPPLDAVASLAGCGAMRAVLERALAKDPAERFARADAMAEALRNAVRTMPTEVPAATVAQAAHRPPAPAPARLTASTERPAVTAGAVARRAAPRTARRVLGGVLAAGVVLAGVATLVASGALGRLMSEPRAVTAPATAAAPLPSGAVSEGSLAPAPTPLALATAALQLTPTAPVTTAPSSPARTGPAATASVSASVASKTTPARIEEPTTPPTTPPVATALAAPTTTPAAGPADALGRITLVTRPHWAHVRIDGQDAGTTPRVVSLPPGPHVLVLEHSGYRPIQRKIHVVAAQVSRIEVDFGVLGIPAP